MLHRHLRARRRAVVARRRRRGTSRRACCRTTWSASRRASRSASSISRRSGSAGIRKVVNGPFTFAPDGNPLVGPMRGLRNFWVACGVMAGFSQGGGVGLALSQWMVDGDPGADIWAMDVARYGDWTTLAYTNAKVRENYSRRFRIRFPNEELPAARPLRTTPIYERLQAEHAVFGDYCALEHALWFAPSAGGGARGGQLPALQRPSARGRGMPRRAQCGGAARDLQLRQVRGHAARVPRSGCRTSWRTASRRSGASR